MRLPSASNEPQLSRAPLPRVTGSVMPFLTGTEKISPRVVSASRSPSAESWNQVKYWAGFG